MFLQKVYHEVNWVLQLDLDYTIANV